MPKVIITGGTGGIGSNIVKSLLKKGGYKIEVWGRDEKKFNRLHDTLDKSLVQHLSFSCVDVSKKEAVKMALSRFDSLDILINAAAVLMPLGKAVDISLE